MDNTRKFMLKVTLGCLAIVTGITVWIISINDTYSVDSSGYIVTLIAEDGIIKKDLLDFGSELTLEGLPQFGFADYTAQKAGYSFNGWGTATGCKTGKTDGIDYLTESKTYYACFINYSVTVDPNGGIINDHGYEQFTLTYKESLNLNTLSGTKTSDNSCSKYKLDSWMDINVLEEVEVLTVTENAHTIRAQWVCDETSTTTKYNVTFDANGGEFDDGNSTKKVEYEEIYYFKNLEVSKKDDDCENGYILVGWNYDGETLTSYVDNKENGKTLTAEWGSCKTNTTDPDPTPEPNPGDDKGTTYNVVLRAPKGTIKEGSKDLNREIHSFQTDKFSYGDYTADKTGFTFTGWGDSENCTKGLMTGDADLTKKTEYYACYTLNENMAMRNWVHLIANGSTINVGDIDDEEYQDQTWEDPKVANYDFTDGDFSFTVARNGRFRASKFTATPKDTTQYFKGWSKNDASCNEVIRYNNVSVTASTTYYACFGKTFNVTFDLNGGDALYNLDGEKITENPLKLGELDYTYYYATKSNSTFWGWSSTKSCKNLIYDVITDDTKYEYLEEDKTLYACYLDAYTVTFDLNGGETLYKKGAKMDENTEKLGYIFYDEYISKKSGSTFSGWSLDKDDCSNAKKNGGKHIEEPTTLYACYNIDGVGGGDDGNIDENVGTGSLLYVIYILGISSLLYTVYYIYKLKKTNMN